LFLVVGAVFFAVIGVMQLRDIYFLEHRGEVATGKVLEVSSGKSPKATVQYVTSAGQAVEDGTHNFDRAEVGQGLDVVYDPRKPHRMQAADYGFSYWEAGIPFIGTLLFGFAALMAFWGYE
jgi:hypothetical protein